jgi:hypothetical protein
VNDQISYLNFDQSNGRGAKVEYGSEPNEKGRSPTKLNKVLGNDTYL